MKFTFLFGRDKLVDGYQFHVYNKSNQIVGRVDYYAPNCNYKIVNYVTNETVNIDKIGVFELGKQFDPKNAVMLYWYIKNTVNQNDKKRR